jgi:hypothetical protein
MEPWRLILESKKLIMKLKSVAGEAKPEAKKQFLYSYGWVPWSNEEQPSSTGGSHRAVETHWLILEQWRLSLGYSCSSGGSVRTQVAYLQATKPIPSHGALSHKLREPPWEVTSYLGAMEGLIRG